MIFSNYINKGDTIKALDAVVPIWLRQLCSKITTTAKSYTVKYGGNNRRTLTIVSGRSALIIARSPHASISAFDLVFTVPPRGMTVDDYQTIFGQAYDNIEMKGSHKMFNMMGKPDSPVYRHYNYTKHKGETISREGYMDRSIRHHIGAGRKLSDDGRRNFQELANALAMHICTSMVVRIEADLKSQGNVNVQITGPVFATSTTTSIP